MSLVVGVDPGLTGALALYNASTDALDISDMPTWSMVINKHKRQRVDAVALDEYFMMAKMIGVQLVVLEAVGGRPKQSASAAFVFGYSVGLIYQACVHARLPVETVPPAVWKRIMRVPGKRDGVTDDKEKQLAIVHRATELMPMHRDKWHGPKGGMKLDRAEAALLAKYGADHALHSIEPDAEWRLSYRIAGVGA